MSSIRSAVASVLRVIAVGLLLLGVVLLVLAYAAGQEGESGFWQWTTGAVGVGGGMVLLIFSPMIARFLTRDYD